MPNEEQQVIKDYVIDDWIDYANRRISEISDSEIYSKFFEVKEILNRWKIVQTDEKLRKFVNFFYYLGIKILNEGLRISNKKYKKELLDWLQMGKLIAKPEFSFFENEPKDSTYSERVSIVL